MAKVSYSYYVQERLEGLAPAARVAAKGGLLKRFQTIETLDPAFPDYAEFVATTGRGPTSAPPPVCDGPLKYRDLAPVEIDFAHLRAAADAAKAPETFMTAASPGVIAMFASQTTYYATEDDYVFALAEAMKVEFNAIYKAGVMLQIDCPDLALAPQMNYAGDKTDPRRTIARNVEALNIATADIPPHAMRVHLCWGNYNGPHARDLEVRDLLPLLKPIRARALSFEAANPRHEHEWQDWRDASLPDDLVLVPGVIDSCTNYVEHPRLVAQRIGHFADIVGRERVIASVDCGFGTFGLARPTVFPSVVWAKLRALAEGAEIASRAH